jgi:hypothetical protein
MRFVLYLLAVICCGLVLAQAGGAEADKRVALVIGNSAYRHTGALTNPRNDADALARLLEKGGSSVTLKIDLDYRALREAVRAFGEAAREADVALIYYAGHGLEVAGQNYLIPVDARLEHEADLEYEAVTLVSVLNAVAGARRLRVVILDACRNNPLGERMAREGGATRGGGSRGLARIEPRRDTLVAYAAKEGTLAQDGAGGNSPYAEALLTHLATPGLDVRFMFGRVRDQVLAATHNNQEPYTYGSLTGEAVPLVPGVPLTHAQGKELAFWSSVKDSKEPAVLRTYLEAYPDGEYGLLARNMIEVYERLLKLELAERDEARKRQEEERVAAEKKRIEEERAAQQAALVEQRKRAEAAKSQEVLKRLEDQAKALTEQLHKNEDELRATQGQVKAAEEKRLAAAKAAEEASKEAQDAIARKREDAKTGSPEKLAALPKIEKPAPPERALFEGGWQVHRVGQSCPAPDVTFAIEIRNGIVSGYLGGGPISGSVSASGQINFRHASTTTGVTLHYSAHLGKGAGSGTFTAGVGSLSQAKLRELAARMGKTLCYGSITLTRG